MKRYKVTLEADERQQLHDLIAAGQAAARKLSHAPILLKADSADGGRVAGALAPGRVSRRLTIAARGQGPGLPTGLPRLIRRGDARGRRDPDADRPR